MRVVVMIAAVLVGMALVGAPSTIDRKQEQRFVTLHSLTSMTKAAEAYISFRTGGPASNPIGPAEVSPFVFNGLLYSLAAISPSGNYSGQLRIDLGVQRPMVTITAPDMAYAVPFVENGVLYIFGTNVAHTQIRMMQSSDLVTFSAPVVVFTAPSGMKFFNTSITKTPTGYVMVAETQDTAYPGIPFVAHFLTSANLTAWSLAPAVFNNGNFINCPTIRYNAADGKFYMLYMSSSAGVYYTFIGRSADLATWEIANGYPDGSTVPFAPATNEGNNNSDVDLIEYQGKVYFTYARGDQVSWMESATAVFSGTMSQYFQSFFGAAPPPPPPGSNLIPQMTGQVTSGVTVTASSIHPANFYAWYAADRAPSTFWHCSPFVNYPHWWRCDFPSPQTINAYSIRPRSTFAAQAPKNFTLRGLNGATWEIIDTQTNQSYVDGTAKVFTLAAPASYTSFELVIDSNVEGSVNLSIGEFELRG